MHGIAGKTDGKYEKGVTLDFLRLGRPPDDAFSKSFNGRPRDECLNNHRLLSLEDARTNIEARQRAITRAALPRRSAGVKSG